MQLGCGAVRDTEASGGHVGTGTCLNLSSCLCAYREIWKARRDIRSSSVPSFFHRTSTATSAAPAHPVAPRRPRSKRDAGITTLHRRPRFPSPLFAAQTKTKIKVQKQKRSHGLVVDFPFLFFPRILGPIWGSSTSKGQCTLADAHERKPCSVHLGPRSRKTLNGA